MRERKRSRVHLLSYAHVFASYHTHKRMLVSWFCAGLDVVQAECLLPRLQPGRDWVLFRQMGAYTTAGACDFNGFNVSEHVPVYFVNS